jgi:hypothetical protein
VVSRSSPRPVVIWLPDDAMTLYRDDGDAGKHHGKRGDE